MFAGVPLGETMDPPLSGLDGRAGTRLLLLLLLKQLHVLFALQRLFRIEKKRKVIASIQFSNVAQYLARSPTGRVLLSARIMFLSRHLQHALASPLNICVPKFCIVL
jgi:hypothetical protein